MIQAAAASKRFAPQLKELAEMGPDTQSTVSLSSSSQGIVKGSTRVL